MLNRRKPMNKIGRRGRMNAKANVAGDKVIAQHGIQWCELNLPGCQGSFGLTRAHRKPRRYCDADELQKYALACFSCHKNADSHGHDYMFKTVNEAIKRREYQP